MKKIIVIAISLIMIAGFIACQDEFGIRNNGEEKILKTPGAGSSPYCPYEVGKTWRYEAITNGEIDYPDDFSIEDTAWSDTFHYFTEVLRETVLTGSDPIDVWETENTSDSEVTYQYAHIESDSAYFYEKLSDSEPWFVFASNPKLGDEWDVVYQIDDTTSFTHHYIVIGDDASANGFDNCLEIDVIPEDVTMYDEYEYIQYWAEGEGTVMSTMYTFMKTALGEDTMYWTFESETRLLEGAGIKE